VDALANVWGEAHRRLANACPFDAVALAEAVAATRLDMGVQSATAAAAEADAQADTAAMHAAEAASPDASRLTRMFRPASRRGSAEGGGFHFGSPSGSAGGSKPPRAPHPMLSPLAAAATGRLSDAARTLLVERRQLLESYVLLQEFAREIVCLLEAKAAVRLTVVTTLPAALRADA
jgi:hypothetical protein